MAKALFSFRGSMHGLKLEQGKFTKALDLAATRLVREAAREWLRAVIVRVPIWTGFAQGSIVFAQGPGGDLVRFLNMSIPVTPLHTTPKWYYPGNSTRVPKTPYEGSRFGSYNFPTAQHVYRFRFTSAVVHLAVNDFYDDHPGAPWGAMEAGYEAFVAYLKANAKNKLPKIRDFIVKGPIIHFENLS